MTADPTQAADEFDRAAACYRDGRPDDAEAICRSLVGAAEHPRALHLMGVIALSRGDVDAAEALMRRAVAAAPGYAQAHFNLGALNERAGRPEVALAAYARAAELRPDDVDAHAAQAGLLVKLDRRAQAEPVLRRLVALQPDHVAALTDLSALNFIAGRLDDAIAFGRRAVAAAPDHPSALLRLGRALEERGDTAEALGLLRRAAVLAPHLAEAANFLGAALLQAGAVDEAESVSRALTAAHPDYAPGWCNLGLALQALTDAEGALAAHRRAVELSPQTPLFHRNLLSALVYAPGIEPAERFAAHRAFGRAMADRAGAASAPRISVKERPRIGFLSSDLRRHPVARNLWPFFAGRDRVKFEYVCYADIIRPDEVTAMFRAAADLWRPIVGRDDRDVARLIRDDGVDVLIHVAGRFDLNRPQVAAWRPAPIQVSLFDAATSGLAEMDYLISDAAMIPGGTREQFTERVVRLPHFYVHHPLDDAPPPGPQRAGPATFGCFNNPTKLNEAVFDAWAATLRAAPAATLLLHYRNRYAQGGLRERVRGAFARRGVDPARIVLDLDTRDMDSHLRLYHQVDIALDTFPFNGSTTTFEALWMGTPVVALAGDSLMSRWGVSMMRDVGLDELIAGDAGRYAALAAGLAGDRARLNRLRADLRARVASSPLCDTAGRARQFERLLGALIGKARDTA